MPGQSARSAQLSAMPVEERLVDRRREPRFDCQQPVRIQNLLDKDTVLEGTLLNISGKGLQIALPAKMAVSTPIRIDIGDLMLLGDVCNIREQDDNWVAGVVLAHSIPGVSALSQLVLRLLREDATPSLDRKL